jgi:FKBP-type peptidyl-prolyl cis-trans isomerase
MMKRTLFFSLALLLAAGIFSTSAYTQQPVVKKETGYVTKLIKTNKKLGKGSKATSGREVSVHYTGWLYNKTAIEHKGIKFDSSHDRGMPIVFTLGAGQVIDGWEKGIEGMKVGGSARLSSRRISAMASAARTAIPNATLVFDAELMASDKTCSR